jgi:hypothetical protein
MMAYHSYGRDLDSANRDLRDLIVALSLLVPPVCVLLGAFAYWLFHY